MSLPFTMIYIGHNGSPYDYVIVDIDIDIDRDRPLTGVQEHSYTKRVGENKARQKKTNKLPKHSGGYI